LEPDDLADPMHAAVLAAALDLRSENRAVNLITLRSRFAAVPFGDEGSVLDCLKSWEFAGNLPNVSDVAIALRELSQRREIVQLGERIAASVHDQAVGPGSLLTDAARSVDDLLAKCRPAGRTLWTMPDAVEDLLSAQDDQDLCIPTGLADFDSATSGGFRRGEFATIGGRPSMGKSALALAIARRVARAGYGVLFYSLEMQRRDCMRRMATDACWTRDLAVSYRSVRAGKLNARERASTSRVRDR
jgi:replicative DNA helicase